MESHIDWSSMTMSLNNLINIQIIFISVDGIHLISCYSFLEACTCIMSTRGQKGPNRLRFHPTPSFPPEEPDIQVTVTKPSAHIPPACIAFLWWYGYTRQSNMTTPLNNIGILLICWAGLASSLTKQHFNNKIITIPILSQLVGIHLFCWASLASSLAKQHFKSQSE